METLVYSEVQIGRPRALKIFSFDIRNSIWYNLVLRDGKETGYNEFHTTTWEIAVPLMQDCLGYENLSDCLNSVEVP